MPVRYFKKLSPDTRVSVADGVSLQFKTLDSVVGFFATDSDYIAKEFERAMTEGRYGLSEIDWNEYNTSYLVKKNSGQTSNPLWREELARGKLIPSSSTLSARLSEVQVAVAVVSPPPASATFVPAAINQPVINKEIAQALPTVEDYKPVVGKRKRANAKP